MVYRGPSKGCGTCRTRRVKCDETKPFCNNCKSRHLECAGYDHLFDRAHRNQNNVVKRKVGRTCSDDKSLMTSGLLTSSYDDWGTPSLVFESSENGSTDSRDSPQSLALSSTSKPRIDNDVVRSLRDVELTAFENQILETTYTISPPLHQPFEFAARSFMSNMYSEIAPSRYASAGVAPYLIPMMKSVSCDSPLYMAMTALAVDMAMLWTQRRRDSAVGSKHYAEAVRALRIAIADPDRSKDDDVLMSAIVLDIHDSLNGHFANTESNVRHDHQRGALALVKHRGEYNYRNEISKAMLTGLQTGMIQFALRDRKILSSDHEKLFDISRLPQTPHTQLNSIALKLTRFLSRRGAGRPPSNLPVLGISGEGHQFLIESRISSDINEMMNIDSEFTIWYSMLPDECKPYLIKGQQIPYSIRTVGVYNDTCALYEGLQVANMLNMWRCRRLVLLCEIKKDVLDARASGLSVGMMNLESINEQIAEMIDYICYSVPFFLGDFNATSAPVYTSMFTFPSLLTPRGQMPVDAKSHARHATAAGAWLTLHPLVLLSWFLNVSEGQKLVDVSDKQCSWIMAQLKRLQHVWMFSSRFQPPIAVSSKIGDVGALYPEPEGKPAQVSKVSDNRPKAFVLEEDALPPVVEFHRAQKAMAWVSARMA